MSRKKNISNFHQKQQIAQKKESKKKRNRIILISIVAVVVVAILATLLAIVISNQPVTVVLEVKDYGKITLELYPDKAPISVDNFVDYVEEGFYDGLTFHRVIEGFMIQGGDPTGTGYGDSTLETIKGEFSANGVDNDLKFERGVIGMARGDDPDSATSQFFIMHKTTESLDGLYAAFGKVVDGMDVVDAIATCEKTDVIDGSGNHYVPKQTITIERAYVVD